MIPGWCSRLVSPGYCGIVRYTGATWFCPRASAGCSLVVDKTKKTSIVLLVAISYLKGVPEELTVDVIANNSLVVIIHPQTTAKAAASLEFESSTRTRPRAMLANKNNRCRHPHQPSVVVMPRHRD